MQKITQETYGIMIYQEQIMQIAVEMAGFTMGEADTLRRAMGKKDRELMAKQKEKFMGGCAERKTSAAKAEKVWELMEKFAGYGFNKCLISNTEVELADGSRKFIVDVRDGDVVLTKNGPARTLGVRPSGIRRVARLRLQNGLEIECTPDHPVFTQRGWVNVEDLDLGSDFVAVVRELPCGTEAQEKHRPALLGYALSEGSLGYDSHFYLYSSSADEIDDMREVLEAFDNTVARVEHRHDDRASSVRPARRDVKRPARAVTFLFDECGMRGHKAVNKRVPSIVDRWDRESIAVLVAKLFQGDGCIHPKTRSIFYATSSEGLARDVRRLLLKLGIMSKIHRKTFAYRGQRRVGFTVNLLDGRNSFSQFRTLVGPHLTARKAGALNDLVGFYEHRQHKRGMSGADVIPPPLFLDHLRGAILKRFRGLGAGLRELGSGYTALTPKNWRVGGIRRDTLARLARQLDDPILESIAGSPLAWSRPYDLELLGEEPTYDIEVPGPASFIANGIVVHNSHAAAYALVAYQTAYFKANYPVEFMAALLTSEMGDTDKIVKYIEECRAIGVEVKPPDVNGSSVQFSVHVETIRFGLAAIKNVGEAAMESILKTRAADGAFTTLDDFCARVDLRLVNRRVIESLIKAGALDSLGMARAQLLAALDAAMESGQRQQRDKAEGQSSFFDLIPAAPPVAVRTADATAIPEWDDDQRLAFEKEVLGFYVSGHPLARFKPLVESLGITPSSEIAGRPGGSRVLLYGQVASLREIPTKSGNRMAFATIEDTDGTVDVTIFPEPFKAGAGFLRSRDVLLIRGKVDDTEKGRVVLAEDVRLLEHALAGGGRPSNGGAAPGPPNACRVRVPGEGDITTVLQTLHRLCAEHTGGVPLFVHLLVASLEVVVRAAGVSVDGSPELTTKIDALLGPGACTVEHAGRS
jgi:DNA polymerase-3 subunit alpha